MEVPLRAGWDGPLTRLVLTSSYKASNMWTMQRSSPRSFVRSVCLGEHRNFGQGTSGSAWRRLEVKSGSSMSTSRSDQGQQRRRWWPLQPLRMRSLLEGALHTPTLPDSDHSWALLYIIRRYSASLSGDESSLSIMQRTARIMRGESLSSTCVQKYCTLSGIRHVWCLLYAPYLDATIRASHSWHDVSAQSSRRHDCQRTTVVFTYGSVSALTLRIVTSATLSMRPRAITSIQPLWPCLFVNPWPPYDSQRLVWIDKLGGFASNTTTSRRRTTRHTGTQPRTPPPRYTTDDGLTGENYDASEDNLQDYDEGGDNSTYLEVQPVDNSGKSSSEQDNDEGSVYYDSDENPHPREHLRREDGGREVQHYHDGNDSQWFLHYQDLYPEGWLAARRLDNDHDNHARTTGTTTLRLDNDDDSHARTTGTSTPTNDLALACRATTAKCSTIDPDMENPEITCSEDENEEHRLAERARELTATRTLQRMEDVTSIRTASSAAAEALSYATQHAGQLDDALINGEITRLGAAARRYLHDMVLDSGQAHDPTRWDYVRPVTRDPTLGEPSTAAITTTSRTTRVRSRTRSRTRMATWS